MSWHHFSLNLSVSHSHECAWRPMFNLGQFYWQHLCCWVLVLVKNLFFPDKRKVSFPLSPVPDTHRLPSKLFNQNMGDFPWASQHPIPWNTPLLLPNLPTNLSGSWSRYWILYPSEEPKESSNCQYGCWAAKNCVRTTVPLSSKSNEQLSGGNKF